MDTQTFSGAYGIVVSLDPRTVAMAKELAHGVEADFTTEQMHLTLFHTKLKDAPLDTIRDIVRRCDEATRDQVVRFERVATFGANFLFWDARRDPAVMRAHQIALELAEYLDRVDLAGHTKGEKLSLPPEEAENIRLYGHPLVRDRYRPHLTLAYHSKGFPSGSYPENVGHEGQIERAFFAEIGQYGRVLREVDLEREGEAGREAARPFGRAW